MSAVVQVVPVLAELEQRAGASDQDREAWLADRRTGITATEVRDLYLKKFSVRELVDRKLGRVPEVGDLSHIPVIGWGKLREPVIAGLVQHRFGIRPESRVFRAADEPRFLASPDGVGVNFDEDLLISEIKTAGDDIPPWSVAYDKKGCEAQQQWGMRVTGARRCLFAWELREVGTDGEFYSGLLRFEWVERNEVLIGKLEAIARRFLAALDMAASEPAPEVEPIDEELDTHAVNYLRALELEGEAKRLKAPAWQALLEAGRSQVSALARITYKAPEPVEVEEIDYAAARATGDGAALFSFFQQAQDEWSAYCEGFKTVKTVTGRPTLRVVAVKPPKTEEQD